MSSSSFSVAVDQIDHGTFGNVNSSSPSSIDPPQDAQVTALQKSVGIVINNTMSNVHQIAELVASSSVYKEQYQYLTSRLSTLARILTGNPLCVHCVSDKKDLIEPDPLSFVSDIITTLSTQLVLLMKKVVPSMNEGNSKFTNSEIKTFAKTLTNIGESLLRQAAAPIETKQDESIKCDCAEILSELSQEERKSMHWFYNPACTDKECKWSSPPADGEARQTTFVSSVKVLSDGTRVLIEKNFDSNPEVKFDDKPEGEEEEPRPDFETRSIVKQEEEGKEITCIECGDDIQYCFMNMRYCDPICLAASYEKDVLKVIEGAKVDGVVAVKILREQHGIVRCALNVLKSKPVCDGCLNEHANYGLSFCSAECNDITSVRQSINGTATRNQIWAALDHCNGDVKKAIEYLNSNIPFGATICSRCKKEECDSDSECQNKYNEAVNMVMNQARVDRDTAEKALSGSKGSVVDAILSLTE